MITAITGALNRVLDEEIRLQSGPFEYAVLVPEFVRRQLQTRLGEELTLHTLQYIEGNQMSNRWVPRLVGFLSDADLEFFDLLCTGKFWGEKYERGDRSARFVRNELRNAFDPAKIEYFVTSSIGFWIPPGWAGAGSDFDPGDFANYHKVGQNEASIRGAISPINVLEPLIRLRQRISGWA